MNLTLLDIAATAALAGGLTVTTVLVILWLWNRYTRRM